MNSPALNRVLALIAIVVIGVLMLYFFGPAHKDDPDKQKEDPANAGDVPPDPRLTFQTPFRNVHPDVKYVGDAACATCHKDLCESYHQHPMGRSASTWPPPVRLEQFLPTAHPSFDGAKRTRYRAEEKAGRLWHSEEFLAADGNVLAEVPVEVAIVIGSGHQARSYLCVREGSLWQTALTWFSTKQRWDLSPGFAPSLHAQRAASDTCLFCHVDRVEPLPGSRIRFQEPIFARQAHIGCERCHGPGDLHLVERTDGKAPVGIDTSIVNPRHLAPELRDAVCQQCHLQGVHTVPRRGRSPFEFRPGLPLELFQSVFVKPAASSRDLEFVGHVEQMAASRCAQESAGRMSCTSCHDPHRDPRPQERETHFRQACVKCHADRGCNLPMAERKAKNDDCSACHMPRRAAGDISHTSVTDHRILRRPGGEKTENRPREGELPISFYHAKSRYAPPATEQERDLGIALAYLVRANQTNGDVGLMNATSSRLRRSTERFPTDVQAWEALSVVLAEGGQSSEALAALERVLAIQPRNEAALSQAATLAMQLNETTKAVEFSRRALEVNPGNTQSRLLRGLACVDARMWKDAEVLLRASLKELPSYSRARAALAACLFHNGHVQESEAELVRAIAFAPEQERSLREWFNRRTR